VEFGNFSFFWLTNPYLCCKIIPRFRISGDHGGQSSGGTNSAQLPGTSIYPINPYTKWVAAFSLCVTLFSEKGAEGERDGILVIPAPHPRIVVRGKLRTA